ncbi:hypothetical protein BIW11_03968, partial [Tropilaelaps mercedesae]
MAAVQSTKTPSTTTSSIVTTSEPSIAASAPKTQHPPVVPVSSANSKAACKTPKATANSALATAPHSTDGSKPPSFPHKHAMPAVAPKPTLSSMTSTYRNMVQPTDRSGSTKKANHHQAPQQTHLSQPATTIASVELNAGGLVARSTGNNGLAGKMFVGGPVAQVGAAVSKNPSSGGLPGPVQHAQRVDLLGPGGVKGPGQQQLTTIGATSAFLKTAAGGGHMPSQQLAPRVPPTSGVGSIGAGGLQDSKKSDGNLMDKPLHMAVPPVAARLAPPTTPISPAMQHPGAHQNQTAQTPEQLQYGNRVDSRRPSWDSNRTLPGSEPPTLFLRRPAKSVELVCIDTHTRSDQQPPFRLIAGELSYITMHDHDKKPQSQVVSTNNNLLAHGTPAGHLSLSGLSSSSLAHGGQPQHNASTTVPTPTANHQSGQSAPQQPTPPTRKRKHKEVQTVRDILERNKHQQRAAQQQMPQPSTQQHTAQPHNPPPPPAAVSASVAHPATPGQPLGHPSQLPAATPHSAASHAVGQQATNLHAGPTPAAPAMTNGRAAAVAPGQPGQPGLPLNPAGHQPPPGAGSANPTCAHQQNPYHRRQGERRYRDGARMQNIPWLLQEPDVRGASAMWRATRGHSPVLVNGFGARERQKGGVWQATRLYSAFLYRSCTVFIKVEDRVFQQRLRGPSGG